MASAGDFSILPAAKAVAAATPDSAPAKPDKLFDQKGTGFLAVALRNLPSGIRADAPVAPKSREVSPA